MVVTSKKQFKRADKSGATLALVIGESEVQNQQVVVKHLLGGVEQQTLALDDIVDYIKNNF
ncbi:histidyl-tRNA synthase [Pasteurella multocida]|nr:histidyl-tRNA synthase [Pasteurella multocida]